LPSPPTGTVTSLFTDIEGSTALLQRLGDRTRWPRKLPEGRILVSILMGNTALLSHRRVALPVNEGTSKGGQF
jgi:hypothetical protein